MNDNWDFYLLRVDDKPASIFTKLDIEQPIPELPYMAYIRLYMKNPKENGLSSNEEFETLAAIEDTLTEKLGRENVAYVGRCTTNSCRDFYFYVADENHWELRVKACFASFQDYQFDTGTREDAQWSSYFSFLAPSAVDRQRIENRRVCAALERSGEKFIESREVDHFAYFAVQENAAAFAAEVAQQGFIVEAISSAAEANENVEGCRDAAFCVAFRHTTVPSFADIDAITLPLFNLAQQHDGYYDGWESVVKD